MLTIAICEDNRSDAGFICDILRRYGNTHPSLKLTYRLFLNAEELLESLHRQPFDLYLLDIIMPGMDGIEIARTIRRTGSRAHIVFMTSSTDFAVEAFSVRAMNYLVKPFSQRELESALDDVVAMMGETVDACTVVRTSQGDFTVRYADIVSVEVTGHILCYTLNSGRTLTSKVLRIPFEKSVEELLLDERFLRPHRSYLINAAYVEKMSRHEFLMSDKAIVPISRLRFPQIKEQYMRYLATQEVFK